ncbi:MAG TPA: hypothetical protein VM911_18640 [Pyrinomonadaceae bacterium]|jgi:hypothetical protein|nr:hypothetical protein [Pyrinomonadaceae bacterium]
MMMTNPHAAKFILTSLLFVALSTPAQQHSTSPATQPPAQTPLAVEEWNDQFDGQALDTNKWERFTFEGGGGGKAEVSGGMLRMRGMGGSRAGVRTKQTFSGDRFIVEATIAKVGAALPEAGQSNAPPGNAILTVLFDGSERNRIEWLLTSDGRFEAWSVVDGKGERLDNRKLGTKDAQPTISIARKGDDYFFALNGEVGMQKSIRNMPRAFRVMLYGYGSSENDWDSVRIVVPQKK